MARELLAESITPDGEPVTLTHDGGRFEVRVAKMVLMLNEVHGSEEVMAELACAPLAKRPGARVLVGGLGMGYTLRAALDVLGPGAEVVVVEMLPALVEWNRGVLGPLAGRPLDDPRVILEVADLVDYMDAGPAPFDALLLDVDNGPEAFSARGNSWLYHRDGLAAMHTALRPGGVLVVWSAFQHPPFMRRLRAAGLEAESMSVRARARVRKGSRHTLYVGRRRA